MKKFRILLSLLAVVAAQAAQAQQDARGSITGTVVNASTGLPVADALVELTVTDGGRVISRTSTTRDDGKFTFGDLSPASGYQIVVTGSGLQPTAHGQQVSRDPWVPLTIGPGEHLTDIRIGVRSYTRISGRVLDSENKPLSNAMVAAMRPVYIAGRRVLQSAATTTTSMNGAYRLFALPAGLYFLRVTPRNGDGAVDAYLSNPSVLDRETGSGRSALRRDPEGYPVTYFPDFTVESARAIYLRDGETMDTADIRVTKVRTGRLRGSIVEPGTGKPLADSDLVMVRRDTDVESNWTRSVNAENGQFDLRAVLPGSYFVGALGLSEGERVWGSVPLDIAPGETRTVAITISNSFDLPGRIVIDADEVPQLDLSKISVHMGQDRYLPIDGSISGIRVTGPAAFADVSSDGSFVLKRIVPWEYRVAVSHSFGPAGLYVKSMTLGATDATQGISLDSPPEDPLEIVLGVATGGLDGRVLDESGKDVGSARVVLVPDRPHRRDLYLTGGVSATGRFRFVNVPPGEYKLFAWKTVPESAWFDPEFLKQHEDRGIPFRIENDAAEYIEVVAID